MMGGSTNSRSMNQINQSINQYSVVKEKSSTLDNNITLTLPLYPIPFTPSPLPHPLYPIPFTPSPLPHPLYPIPFTPSPLPHPLYPNKIFSQSINQTINELVNRATDRSIIQSKNSRVRFDPERVPFGQTHFWVKLTRNLSQKCLSDSDSGSV